MSTTTADALDTPQRQRRRKALRFSPWLSNGTWRDVMDPRPAGGRVRAVRRIASALIWTLICLPVQSVLVLLPGRAKVVFARWYFAGACRLIGIKVQVVGVPTTTDSTLYLSNHSSWVDILVLGSVLDGVFVSKAEIGSWPLVGFIARLGRTVFVSRRRGKTGQEAEIMRERLAKGQNLILFPEGTSNDGSRTLPFRSSFLAIADRARTVQPISLAYDRVGGLPACRRDRPLFAWYGDMDLAAHVWRLARHSGARATVLVHASADPATFPNRKMLTAAVERVVADGAAQLRQNRAAVPRSLDPGPLAGG